MVHGDQISMREPSQVLEMSGIAIGHIFSLPHINDSQREPGVDQAHFSRSEPDSDNSIRT
jgi:hypothetical protein